jgi:hypothetical protein
MISKNWKYGVDESVVENHGDRYPYIESPEGEKLWLADLDPRQRALAERLVKAANLGNSVLGTSAATGPRYRRRRLKAVCAKQKQHAIRVAPAS